MSEAITKQPGGDVVSRWFHGPHYTDIFVDTDGQGRLLRAEISFGGLFARWENGHVHTGATDEMQVHDGMPQSRFMREHAHADPAVVNAARLLAAHLEDKDLAASLTALFAPGSTPASDV